MAAHRRTISNDRATAGVSGIFGQMFRFATVGVANTAIGLAAIFGLMFFLDTGPAVANAAGYALGLSVGFALNRFWTFQDGQHLGRQVPKYLLIVCLSYAANLAATVGAISLMSMNPYLAQLLGVGVYTSLAFCGCRWFVFTSSKREQM